ncbi:MAG TPA: histidine phosphatase family protein, partial [Acidimicrobiia bacterium]|nr:histidine phosphatase family protein [Acidimicrobiia bacterium]
MIVLVRHGETGPNRDRRLLGRDDPPLTDLGRRQCEALAAALVAMRPDAVVTSPMSRTRATAETVAGACGVPVEVDDRLVEIDYGTFDGTKLAELPPDVMRAMREDPDFAPPSGESMRTVMERMASWCEEQFAGDPERVVVAVTHVSPIKAAVSWALGAEPTLAWRMFVGLASIT